MAHHIPVHYVSTATHIRQATLRHHTSPSNIHFHGFEVPPFVSPPPNPNQETNFPSHLIPSFEAAMHLREPVRELIQSLSSQAKRVVVIHDSLIASVAQDAINMPSVEKYAFHIYSAFNNAAFIDNSAFNNSDYSWEEMGIPPVGDFHFPEFPSAEGCVAPEFKDFHTAQYELLKFRDGDIYNTSRVVEGPFVELLRRISGGKKVWALGPLNPLAIEKKDFRHPCMEWLDKQEPNSVIYVSFGTMTTLTEVQIQMIASGLVQSKQKFIWVLRDADKGNIFDGSEANERELLNGFEERVKCMGLVIRDWAPQLEILSHPSTGGFMSQCGWNSFLESITLGAVPIAAWPMHSDQPKNAVYITEVLKVGLVVKDWAKRKELVTASDVENAVRRLMQTKEGDEMRERALKLKNAIHKSVDEGGVTGMEMESFISHITR